MTESVSLNFDMSNYYGVKDKAQINFNDNGLVSESIVSFTITSTSDTAGFRQDAIFYSSYKLDNGIVGFTTGESRNGYIQEYRRDDERQHRS